MIGKLVNFINVGNIRKYVLNIVNPLITQAVADSKAGLDFGKRILLRINESSTSTITIPNDGFINVLEQRIYRGGYMFPAYTINGLDMSFIHRAVDNSQPYKSYVVRNGFIKVSKNDIIARSSTGRFDLEFYPYKAV